LVLLAVVLIVALVSVALLGFFPGMASDSQETQSKMYWQSASPIAITEWAASISTAGSPNLTCPYLRIRNVGAYPLRITKVLSKKVTHSSFVGGGAGCSPVVRGAYSISDYFYLAPGEEKYFGYQYTAIGLGTTCDYAIGYDRNFTAAYCEYSGKPSTLVLEDFGFEYIVYIDGQQITKKEIGKPLVIKCVPAA
jgi:hypothetical protein